MSAFDDMLARDAAGLARGGFGEVVTFTPVNGEPVDFRAVVERMGRIKDPDTNAVHEYCRVMIPRDTTLAAGVDTVREGDQVTLAFTIGGTAHRARIVDVEAQDAGGFTVQVAR